MPLVGKKHHHGPFYKRGKISTPYILEQNRKETVIIKPNINVFRLRHCSSLYSMQVVYQ